MYETISDFLKTLSADNSALWAILVLGVVVTLSLVLYNFWEIVLRIAFQAPSHLSKNRLLIRIKSGRLRRRQLDPKGSHRK